MNKTDELKQITLELLEKCGVVAEVEVTEKEENSFEVDIKTETETGLLIGFRGENIDALQTVLSLMFKNKAGEWARIIVNVGDYRQKQEDKLKILADQTISRAIETGEPQPIYNLTPSQRRVIHLYVTERTDVESYSEGEGDDRYIVVKSK